MPDTPESEKPHLTIVTEISFPEESDPVIEPGVNDEAIMLKVRQLEEEHRDLDNAITTMEERMPYDRLTLMRMKKRKLVLKDKIARLSGSVLPDIIA